MENVGLPDVCMCCGTRADYFPRRTFRWCPRWVIVLLLISPLIYVIVAAILTKSMRVRTPMCDRHRNYWRVYNGVIYGGLAVLTVALVVLIVLAVQPGGTPG